MNLKEILEKYAKGHLSIEEVQRYITINSIEHVGNNLAQLDIGRDIRKGVPEVIFAQGKEYQDIVRIVLSSIKKKEQVVISKIKRKDISRFQKSLKKRNFYLEVGKNSTTILISKNSYTAHKKIDKKIGILAAGTSDIGIAEEARLIAKAMGCGSIISYDVGIAGMNRIFPALQDMIAMKIDAIIVVAGMEGALASVISSIVDVPVIGVPTSVGYGFGSDGMAALASMLQSCTFGLAVVNIDNGVGAGALAALIANRATLKQQRK